MSEDTYDRNCTCYCDISFDYSITGCSEGPCMFYAVFCCISFTTVLILVGQQLIMQTMRKDWRDRPNVNIQIVGYSFLIGACVRMY